MSDTTKETQWYIAREGQQHGPLTDPEMQLFVTGGHLKPTDLVWRPSFTEWRPAQTIFPPKPKTTEQKPAPSPTPAATTSAPDPTKTTSKPTATTGPATENLSARSPRQSATAKPIPGASPIKTPTGPATIKPDGPRLQPTPRTASPALSSSPLGRQPDGLPGQNQPLGQTPRQPQNRPLATPAPAPGATAAPGAGGPSAPAGPGMLATGQPRYDHAPATSPTTGNTAPPEPTDDPDFGYLPERKSAMPLRIVATLAVLAVIGGGAYLGYQNRDQLSSIATSLLPPGSDSSTTKSPPVVTAKKKTKTAAPAPVAPPPQATPAVAPVDPAILAGLDEQFQKSALWSLLKAEYPQWYEARLKQVVNLNATSDDPEVTKHLLAEIVALRRKHADEALAASTDKLRGVAAAFLANLQRLAQHSPDACSTFISNGELSPKVLNLLSQKDFGPTLEVQATAIFQAISEGRKSPIKRERAGKTDYNVLTRQLSQMGWTQQDFQLFANRSALASAPPAKKCQMLQDWFAAHIAIPDASVQERLLFETLRPVVAG